jgi:DNA end-binding protein Ku
MARAVWKGAIAFGLVHIPVALYPASQETEVDFDWLDRRTMDPVGYKRINKRTGKEIAKEDIVKGVKHDGSYVVLSDDEVREAYPKTTQTIEIESFVPAGDISFVYLERPYYLEPTNRAEKVYTLLREAMSRAALVGIARIVMHNKEHLAALLPAGPALMLGTLRWANEIRPAGQVKLPPPGGGKLKDAELKMAGELIRKMAGTWKPQQFADRFSDAIRKLVARKAAAGESKPVAPLEEAPAGPSNVIDLSEMLRNSLRSRRRAASTKAASKRSAPTASKARAAGRRASSRG